MSTPRHVNHSRFARQQGAVTVIVVLFLLLVLGAALGTILQTSGSGATDATAQDDSVAALFLAESGVEHAMARLPVIGCVAGLTTGNIVLGRGTFAVQSATVAGANCQVNVRGTVGTVARTVEALLSNAGGAITASAATVDSGIVSVVGTATLSVPHNVTAGRTLLLVGITTDRTDTSVGPPGAPAPTYGGLPLQRAAFSPSNNNNRPKTEIWYLVNPPAGLFNVVVTPRGPLVNPTVNSDEVVVGVISFSGVSATNPQDVPAVTLAGGGTSANLSITPITNGAWVFDVLSVNNNPNPAINPPGSRVERWRRVVNSNITGVAATIGPINPAATINPRWTWTSAGNERWAQAAVALRPGGSPQVLQWREVIN